MYFLNTLGKPVMPLAPDPPDNSFKMAAVRPTHINCLPLVVVLGCTGTGKSKLALELGQKFNGEIISADSMQVYKGLDIITNKVTSLEQSMVKHHLLDFVSPLKQFTVVDFKKLALPKIFDIMERGKVPIVVGGTNYYIESLLWNILFDNEIKEGSNQDEDKEVVLVKDKVRPSFPDHDSADSSDDNDDEEIDIPELYKRLQVVDPVMAERLHPNDVRKVSRSLKVFEQFGIKHSELIADQQKEGGNSHGGSLRFQKTCVFWLQSDRDILNQRLDARVDSMLQQGMLKELTDFHNDYNKAREGKDSERYTEGIFQSIGFKEFHKYLTAKESNDNLNDVQMHEIFARCVDDMKTRTRKYAKKQIAWVKHRFLSRPPESSPDIYGLDVSDLSKWKENVFDISAGILSDVLQGKKPSVSPLARNESDKISKVKRHVCMVCNEKIIMGNTSWENHISSKSHKYFVKKARLQEHVEKVGDV